MVAALGATRAINTGQSKYSAEHGRTYATRDQLTGYVDPSKYSLAEGTEIVPGFMLTLDTTQKGYWFEIKDVTDGCGFRFISNQVGLIFTAAPIR